MAVPGQNPPPLDARKQAWMVSTRAAMRADRAVVLVGVVINAQTGTTYVVLSGCVFREHMAADQTMALTQGTNQIDALVELPLTDPVTGQANTPSAFAYLARTTTATAAGVQPAKKYEIVSWKAGGIITNRYVCQLRRMR
jgi:hypothetical protein